MRHSVLCLVVFSLFSLIVFAQHSSGGGGGSSAGSSGGSFSGGSHGGSSGGSSGGSGGSHSSGGSSSHASSSGHGSAAHGSAHGTSAPAGHGSALQLSHVGMQTKTVQPHRRVFSALRHPFKKPEPKEVVELRHRICPNGRCEVCPPRSSRVASCGAAIAVSFCTQRQLWSGDRCLYQTHFLDDCSLLRMDLDRQEAFAQTAELTRQTECAAGASAGCSEATTRAQVEDRLYQAYLNRYLQCRDRRLFTQPFGGYIAASPDFAFDFLVGVP